MWGNLNVDHEYFQSLYMFLVIWLPYWNFPKHVFLKHVFSYFSRKENPIVVERWVVWLFVWNFIKIYCLLFVFGMSANCMCLIVLMKNLIYLGGRKPPCKEEAWGWPRRPSNFCCYSFLLVSECTFQLCLLVCFDLFYFILFFCGWVKVMFLSCCYCCSRSAVSRGLLLS